MEKYWFIINRNFKLPACGVIILLFITAFINKAEGQTKDAGATGSIKGKIKDSALNFALSSATVAVYKASDSSLVRFSLPDHFGEFLLEPLPLDIRLRLIITHIGYKACIKEFKINKDNKVYDFDWIYLLHDDSASTEKEVIVRATAPLHMNGDTVEFNPRAFKLDSNATAEDLLRKLPGFTIWGDGDITFRGKKLNAVLVDGKPFLGGKDFAAATQNLPKDALDKVQVYQQPDEKNPLDSTLFANLKLKEGKKMGYFGKASAAYGTGRHYDFDGMFTGFNRKLQLSGVGATNDVNKIATSTDMLIRNNSFKGVGANSDYQTNFTINGVNKPVAAGVKLQYDFIPDVQQKTSRLNADYFVSRNNLLMFNNTTTNTFLGADSILTLYSNRTNTVVTDNQTLNASYQRSSPKAELNITSVMNINHNHSESENLQKQEQTGWGTESSGMNNSESDNKSRSFKIINEYTNKGSYLYDNLSRVSREFTVRYTFDVADNHGSGRNQSSFQSGVNSSANKNYDRLYDRRDSVFNSHDLYVEYPRLQQLIFGRRRRVGGLQIGIAAEMNIAKGAYTDDVKDLDTNSGKYFINAYLTNRRNVNISDMNPILKVSKRIDRILTNRYAKSLSFNLNIKEQYYSFDHRATQAVQNVKYSYSRFIPDASINYHNHQFGSYEIYSDLTLQARANYPTIDRIAPLVDSTNFWYIPRGNYNLQPESEKDLVFNFKITSRKPRNPFELQINTIYSYIDNRITDSILYNNIGQQTIYPVNRDGGKSFTNNAGYRKAFERKGNTFQFHANYNYAWYQIPGYINSVLNISNSTAHNGVLGLNYAHKDNITLGVEQSLIWYKSQQEGFSNSSFKNRNEYTRFSGVLQWPKNLVWSSNVSYNRSVSDKISSIRYTIWNASLAYRFLHGNKGEVKLSALDLLHQNQGVTNTTKGNIQTIGTNNVLQQYFILSLSYYPRKFGR